MDAPPSRVTGVDVPMPYAFHLEQAALPQAHDVLRVGLKTLNLAPPPPA